MLLQQKVALITGAARGIGYATARLYAQQGAHVFLSGRQPEALAQARQAILAAVPDAQVDTLVLDVSSPDSVRDAFQSLFKQTKRLDVLVANAGVMEDALVGMATPDMIARTFQTNTFGVLYCAQYASRLMARSGGGSIINISSIMGVRGNAGQSAYAGSKAAVIGITQSLAKELGAQQIRVNAIAPGLIDTELTQAVPADKLAAKQASIVMGRIGSADEVAQVALFLASPMAAYVTGQVIGVDGGMQV
jgi:3-oxoacyl-[acyl-carrier protein] reductase